MGLDTSLGFRMAAVILLHCQQHPQFFGEALVIVLILKEAVIALRQVVDGKAGAARTAGYRVHRFIRPAESATRRSIPSLALRAGSVSFHVSGNPSLVG